MSRLLPALAAVLLLAAPVQAQIRLRLQPPAQPAVPSVPSTPLEGLVQAIRKGDLQLARSLLQADRGLLVAADAQGARALHAAVAGASDLAAVQWLVAEGADPNATDARGSTALHYAASLDLADIAAALLDRGAAIDAVNADGDTPLTAALRRRGREVAGLLIDRGADIHRSGAQGLTPLATAVREGNLALAARLLSRCADANLGGPQGAQAPAALAFAARRGIAEALPLLRLLAAHRGDLRRVFDDQGRGLLHLALLGAGSEAERAARAVALTGLGLDANARDGRGRTALHVAARFGDAGTVAALLRGGANPDVIDSEYATALLEAVESGKPDAVRVLLEARADPNIKRDPRDMKHTPLTLAAWLGRLDMVDMLLAGGADPGLVAARRTPLEWAQRGNRRDVVLRLGGPPP